ncbi:MAG TPA: GAF domain-containing protein [Actinomycetes bacterium]|nr:GAF domain-containing protein [Actinomycetes bacterium]
MRARIPWLLVALSSALVVADTIMDAQVQPLSSADSVAVHGWPLIPAAALGSSIMGAVILSRLPRHPIGWLLAAVGTLTCFSVTCEIYSIWVDEAGGPGSELAAEVTGWLSVFTGGSCAFAGLTLMFLLAPDGHLLSPRWRWAAWADGLGLLLFWVGLLNAKPKDFTGRGDPRGTSALASTFLTIGILLITAVLVLAVVSVVIRMRRSTGETRQQLRWFALAAVAVGVGVVGLLVVESLNGGDQTWYSAIPLQVAFVLLPVFLAIAVLRYRLYDVDVIINRAVVVGVAAVFVAVGYTLLVVGVSGLLGDQVSGFWPSVIATAAVAMAFQPLRRRVVRFADRLAYGPRAVPYDALSAFSRRLGDSPEPAALLPAVAEAAGRAVSASRCLVTLDVDRGETRTASWSRSPRAARSASGADLTVPVADAGGPLGSIMVTPAPGRTVRPHERALLEDLAEQAAVSFRNARLEAELAGHVADLDRRTDELAASRRRLFEAGDAERRRLEHAIDRDVMPTLRSLTATLESPGAAAETDALVDQATTALDALRELTRGIFPTMLARAGIAPALTAHLARAGSPARLVVAGSLEGRRFAPRTEAAAYYAATVAAAAGARGTLSLGVDDGCLVLEVDGAAPLGDDREAVLDRVDALGGSLVETDGWLRVTVPTVEAAPVPVPREVDEAAPVAP